MRRIFIAAIMMPAALTLAAAALADAAEDVAEADRLSDKGRFEQAIELYSRAIDSGELSGYDLAAAYYSRGLSQGRLRNNEAATSDYHAALDADPTLVSGWSSLCYQRSRNEAQLAEALLACDKALELDPGHGPSYGIRAEIQGMRGNIAEAEKDYAEAIRLAPDNWALYFNRGVLYHRENRREEAERDFSEAYGRAPGWARQHPTAVKMFREYGFAK